MLCSLLICVRDLEAQPRGPAEAQPGGRRGSARRVASVAQDDSANVAAIQVGTHPEYMQWAYCTPDSEDCLHEHQREIAEFLERFDDGLPLLIAT